MKTEYKLLIETTINKDKNYIYGEEKTPLNETVIADLKSLYKFGLKNHGRCVTKIFVDRTKKAFHVGYVFEKKCWYEDTREPFITETWLSIEHYIETVEREYLEVK